MVNSLLNAWVKEFCLPIGFEFLTEQPVIVDDDGNIVEEEGEETW